MEKNKNTDSLFEQGVARINECIAKAIEHSFGKENAERYENFAEKVDEFRKDNIKKIKSIVDWVEAEQTKAVDEYKKASNSFLAGIQNIQKEVMNSFLDGFKLSAKDVFRKTDDVANAINESYSEIHQIATASQKFNSRQVKIANEAKNKFAETLLATQKEVSQLFQFEHAAA